MNLPKTSIKNAQFVLIMVLIGIVIGMQSLERMPRSEDPSVNFPFYNIIVIYPGTSPQDMENLIVDPLEEVLDEIDDIDELRAFIGEGIVNISMQGSYSIDPDEQFDEVSRVANSVRANLPDGIVNFDVQQYKPSDRTVIHQFAMVSESVSYSRLLDQAEDFEKALEKIDGLKAIEIEAYPAEEVRVSLDFQRMASQNIALQQVLQVLGQNNSNIPGGAVNAQGKSFSLKTTGGYKNLQDIQNTVISASSGNIVYLRDIATVAMD